MNVLQWKPDPGGRDCEYNAPEAKGLVNDPECDDEHFGQ
jgi:hypothetical protein